MSVNRVILIGRLTRDPEHRSTTTGKVFATFGIAVRKRFKPQDPNERDADFFNIKVWGQTADYAKNYLAKGRLVAVDGRIETRKYTDQQGVTREVFDIVADNVNALDGPKDADDGGAAPTAPQAPATANSLDTYDPFEDE